MICVFFKAILFCMNKSCGKTNSLFHHDWAFHTGLVVHVCSRRGFRLITADGTPLGLLKPVKIEYGACQMVHILNEYACSGYESSTKVLFEHHSTTFLFTNWRQKNKDNSLLGKYFRVRLCRTFEVMFWAIRWHYSHLLSTHFHLDLIDFTVCGKWSRFTF